MIILLSRDKRVSSLFRASWIYALDSVNCNSLSLSSGRSIFFKILFTFNNLFRLYKAEKVVVFGLQDVIFFNFFLFFHPNLHFVATGFGRLWINKFLNKFIKLILRVFFKNDRISVLNHHDYSELQKLGLNKITLLNGEGHPFLNTSPKLSRSYFDSPVDSSFNFIYVGRLLKSKGILETTTLIREFASFFSVRPIFTLVGDEDFKNRDSVSKKFIISCSQRKFDITFHNFDSNPWKFAKSHSIFISLSVREGLPFSVLEALHLSFFCILSPVPGHLCFEGIEGVFILCENYSLDDLKDRIYQWHSLSLDLRQASRSKELFKYSELGTIKEKLSFLGLD
jgi:glycosyltransferase involved in cell wall biosynthesis